MTGEDLARLAALADPVRRAVYDFVVAQDEPVGRDATAHAVGVTRRVAATHLDLLATVGLLDVSFRRLTSRRGPGSGRPAKMYARAAAEVSVTVPPRRYDVAAQVFAAAAADLGAPAVGAVSAAAFRIGAEAAAEHERTTTPATPRAALDSALRAMGYEPYDDGGTSRLRNCPFSALAERHRELVCTANLHLIRGALHRLGSTVRAELDPIAGECCVALVRREE